LKDLALTFACRVFTNLKIDVLAFRLVQFVLRGPPRLTLPMNRLTGLNGFDTKKNIQSNTGTSVGDEAILTTERLPLFFSPLHYESRYDYPLIVWLHGSGSSERELEDLMPYISIRNYVAVAPRGTKAVDPNGHRYSWAQTPASIALAEELVFDAVEKASRRFTIAPRKIFIAGRGAGGTMAWRVALRNPKQFAGCVSLGGAFPTSHRPLSMLKDVRHLRSLWMVGEQSTLCGADMVVESLPLLHSASLKVAIRQYNCGDDLYADMFSDMNRWLMEIVTDQPATPIEEPCVWGGMTGRN
jgi:phospholipase/carboxylesterase